MKKNLVRKNAACLLAISMLATGCSPKEEAKKPPSSQQTEGTQEFVTGANGAQPEGNPEGTASQTATKKKNEKPATISQVAHYLVKAADDYTPGLTLSTLLDGFKDTNKNITREESLIMISRAFGELPKPTGNTERISPKNVSFSDVSEQAKKAVNNLTNGGVLPATEDGKLKGNETVSIDEVDTIVRRIFVLKGSNLKDDFFSFVNKKDYDKSVLPPGATEMGGLSDLQSKVHKQVSALVKEVASGSGYAKGSKEQKIKDLYNSTKDMKKRNELGIKPIQKYLDAIDNAKTVEELNKAQIMMQKELTSGGLLSMWLMTDYKDSNKMALNVASAITPYFTKEQYENLDDPSIASTVTFHVKMLMLTGVNEEKATELIKARYKLEQKLLSFASTQEELSDSNKMYARVSLNELQQMAPTIDVKKMIKAAGFTVPKEFVINEPKMFKGYVNLLKDENLDALKTVLKLGLIESQYKNLSEDFIKAYEAFNQEMMGQAPSEATPEDVAAENVIESLGTYVSQLYVEKHFSKEAKADVEKIIKNYIEVYKERIDKLDWMSKSTKEKAIEKLDGMKFFIGYPDKWDTDLDQIEITDNFFENQNALNKASRELQAKEQNRTKKANKMVVFPHTVNAAYNQHTNTMEFPAAILQAPFYDVNASLEENLAGIGDIIAHEITHAFDNNGAKFDANGNETDWWTKEDYAKFQKLCKEVEKFYDGKESAPGVAINGKQTLGENIADLGAMASTLEVLKKSGNPDYDTFFTHFAKNWARAMTRERAEALQATDEHSTGNLRVNRTIVNFEEFYKTYTIKEGDGMYVAPKNRISIW
ncbi:M13-type metalloendopeptidase [Bacillus sp. 1P06AnD]|uniref:M13-type metalloendopeptidase n=1 Tax=Bacillus sp. 1P06AnD TaxID=3132208 RepID=UPI0039A01879